MSPGCLPGLIHVIANGMSFETKADMEFFLGQLPILSFDLFRRHVTQTDADVACVFTFSTAGATATARESDDGFVVLAGSTARKLGTETFPAGYQALRDQLVQDGRLVDGPSPELYRFAMDVPFASPSAAASIVADTVQKVLQIARQGRAVMVCR
jgi:hypothetical protein